MRIVARLETESVLRQVSGSPEQVVAWTRQALMALPSANTQTVEEIMAAVRQEMAHFGYSEGWLCVLRHYGAEGWFWPHLGVWAFEGGKRLPIYTTVAWSDGTPVLQRRTTIGRRAE